MYVSFFKFKKEHEKNFNNFTYKPNIYCFSVHKTSYWGKKKVLTTLSPVFRLCTDWIKINLLPSQKLPNNRTQGIFF